jgi:HK97 family phage major capsid protein
VDFPKVVQADAGAEGDPDEFAEFGGVSCDWTPEGSEAPDSDATFEQVQFTPHWLPGYTEVTRALMNRAANLSGLLTELFRAAFQAKLQRAIINGDGIGRPLGVLQAASVPSVQRAIANQVAAADLVNMEDKLPAWLLPGAMWSISKPAMKYLKNSATTRALFDPAFTRLLGHPFTVHDEIALGTAGDVVFGDFSWYVLGVEDELLVSTSDQFKFAQVVTAILAEMRVDGKPMMDRAFVKLANPA